MTPLFPAHRAAEEFDSVLEGRATTLVAERYSGLAATVQVLRDQPDALPREAFVLDLRERLMLAAETDMVPAAPVVRRLPSTSRRNRRLGTVAASLVIVGGSAGMAAAASGAQPGQALYPIKRGVEQVQIASHFSDAAKGSALLGQAGTRLDEVQQLVGSGADQSLIDSTVADFRDSANAGADKLFNAYRTDADASNITAVRDFTTGAMEQVDAMTSGADPSTVSALRDTADAVADLDQQATTLCAACGSATALDPPQALVSSAGAASVTGMIARPVAQATKDIETQTKITEKLLQGLGDRAQTQADRLTKAEKAAKAAGAAGAPTLPPGTVTSSGDVVPNVVDGAASTVTNLVTGLTSTVDKLTGGGAAAGDPTTPKGPLGDNLGKVGKGLDGTLDGLNDSLGGLTKNLVPKN